MKTQSIPHMHWLILLPFLIFIEACAISAPTMMPPSHFSPGQTKDDIDLYFSNQNNGSGQWRVRQLYEAFKDKQVKSVYLYRWQAAKLLMWRQPGIPVYQLTFLNHRLTKHTIWAPNQNSNINPKCKTALIYNRSDEIAINC